MPDEYEADGMRQFEQALQGLTPAMPSFHRDRLLYAAGQASVRRRSHWWPTIATCGWFFALAGTGLWWTQRPEPATASRPIPAVLPAPSQVVVEGPDLSEAESQRIAQVVEYFRLRNVAAQHGSEQLPPSATRNDQSGGPSRPLRLKDLL